MRRIRVRVHSRRRRSSPQKKVLCDFILLADFLRTVDALVKELEWQDYGFDDIKIEYAGNENVLVCIIGEKRLP